MINEAAEVLTGTLSYDDIKNYINAKWTGLNQDSIVRQIIVLSVNHKSRVFYPENYKPRITDSSSQYDILFNTGRGEVERYDPSIHGVWEIYKDDSEALKVKMHSSPAVKKVFTPMDIIWFKNVTNVELGEAYMQLQDGPFVIHFPTKHKSNVLSPKVNELMLIYQKIYGSPGFTHLVTPVDDELIDDDSRPNYRYGRRVRLIANTIVDDFIPVSSTLWNKLNFSGITQGNACKLENINGVKDLDELRLDIWQRLLQYFLSEEKTSTLATFSILDELALNSPEISVAEGKLKLVAHLVRERNKGIVKIKKQLAIDNDALQCEVCGFSFNITYQSQFIECHHIFPISQIGVSETTLDDLALVCANCHRMLHTKFDGKFLSIAELQQRIHIYSSMP